MVRGPKTPYIATQGLYMILFRDANPVLKYLRHHSGTERKDAHEYIGSQVNHSYLIPHATIEPGPALPTALGHFSIHMHHEGTGRKFCTLKEPRIRPGSDGGFSCDTLFDARLRQAGRARESACAPREEVILFS